MESATVVAAGLDSVGGSVSKRRTTMVGRCHSMDHDHTPAISQFRPPISMNRQPAFTHGSTTIMVGFCPIGGTWDVDCITAGRNFWQQRNPPPLSSPASYIM
mmetsp:Transcript_20651/g.33531  ORF Transcript_20651/g.33531 Transcript_20651/m.33531 type:complete len:102 (-) Transcript_20651:44-349(-)